MSHLFLLQARPLTSYLAARGPRPAARTWLLLPGLGPSPVWPAAASIAHHTVTSANSPSSPRVAGSPAPRKLSPLVMQVTAGPRLSHRTAPQPRSSFWGGTSPKGKGSGEALLSKIQAPRGMLGRQAQTQACTPPPKPTLGYVTQAAWKGRSSGVAPRKLAETGGSSPSCSIRAAGPACFPPKSRHHYLSKATALKLSWGRIEDRPALGRGAVKLAQLRPFPTHPKHTPFGSILHMEIAGEISL